MLREGGQRKRPRRSPRARRPPPRWVSAPDIAGAVASVDRLLEKQWQRAGVTPAAAVDDAAFLRRASLDLIGVVPSADEAQQFIDAASEGKRAALVDSLVRGDAYAKHWTNYWDDLLMAGGRNQMVDRVAFRQWLYRETSGGTTHDELVRRLITASGVNSSGGRRNAKMMTDYEDPSKSTPAEGVNGAVNWLVRGTREPQKPRWASIARVFGRSDPMRRVSRSSDREMDAGRPSRSSPLRSCTSMASASIAVGSWAFAASSSVTARASTGACAAASTRPATVPTPPDRARRNAPLRSDAARRARRMDDGRRKSVVCQSVRQPHVGALLGQGLRGADRRLS